MKQKPFKCPLQKKKLIFVAHVEGGVEALKKRSLVASIKIAVKAGGYEFTQIENSLDWSNGERGTLDEVVNCPEYAVRCRDPKENFFRGLIGLGVSILTSFSWTRQTLCRDFEVSRKPGRLTGLAALKRCLRIIGGWGKLSRTVDSIEFGSEDIVVTWGEVPTLHQILRMKAKKVGAKFVTAEFGELQGCFFLSESGIFSRSWPCEEKQTFAALAVSERALDLAMKLRKNSVQNKVSNKRYSETIDDLSAWIDGRKVIFFPGLYSLGAGLVPEGTQFAKDFAGDFGSNAALLRELAQLAAANDWCVIYKDHPNTVNYTPRMRMPVGRDSDFVWVLGDVDIYEAIKVSDVMVSLASKSIFIGLYCGVPVVEAAPFTTAGSGLVIDLNEISHLEEAVREAFDFRPDPHEIDRFNGRLIQYYLYSLEEEHDDFIHGPDQAAQDLIAYWRGERQRVSLADDVAEISCA